MKHRPINILAWFNYFVVLQVLFLAPLLPANPTLIMQPRINKATDVSILFKPAHSQTSDDKSTPAIAVQSPAVTPTTTTQPSTPVPSASITPDVPATSESQIDPVTAATQPTNIPNDVNSSKYDGDCQIGDGGRCADKCPNPNDTLQGYDKETGAAVCRNPPTGCPYGDSVPLGPECDRLANYQ